MDKDINISHIPKHLWMPVRTKPRQEKKLVEYCDAYDIKCYLPLKKNVHRYQNRTVEFFVPMFPGYVFCNLNEDVYQLLVRSNSVLFKIKIDEAGEAYFIEELNSIRVFEKACLESDVIIKPELKEGAKIKIISGPMAGVAGVVEKRKGKTMVTVNIDILGQSISTEIDAGDLEPEND
jgi:transcription antitermination factor NusG